MAQSSPARPRSHLYSSPRSVISEVLGEGKSRNSLDRNLAAIQRQKQQSDALREECNRILERVQLEEQRQRLLEQQRDLDEQREEIEKQQRQLQDHQKQEEERIRREQALAEDRLRLLKLQQHKVEIPASPTPPSNPVQAPAPTPAAPTTSINAANQTAPQPGPQQHQTAPQPAQQQPVSVPHAATSSTQPANAAAGGGNAHASTGPPMMQLNGNATATHLAQRAAEDPRMDYVGEADRYTQIHANLKELRHSMADQARVNPAVRGRMGDMRREIRKCVGQLTAGVGKNRIQQASILGVLREALHNPMQSLMVDPSIFILEPREPVNGAVHNGLLPSIFLYILNILSKSAILQFVNEAGARPETADPVGVILASTFSEPDFQWRGGPLVDILLAKFRLVCPVLFGLNGNEKTVEGRARLGWRLDRVSNRFVPEQTHMDRMTGLAAGFAALSLRNFRKVSTTKSNPYPPRNYWMALARIVNTPPKDVSNTQCVVLKGMIENYESKFIEAYGNAAIAALRLALVDFPGSVQVRSAAVSSLEVLASVLKRDTGLELGQ